MSAARRLLADRVEHNLTLHRPSEEIGEAMDAVRTAYLDCARRVIRAGSDAQRGAVHDELLEAMALLEQSCMFAIASLARHQHTP